MRIMVYGDSNSWGYLDEEDGLREPQRFERRWPVVMVEALAEAKSASTSPPSALVKNGVGTGLVLVEECLPGRTTDLDDPLRGACMNGARPLEALLLSHAPLDLILLMLGTNDLKSRYDRSAAQIVGGMMALADTITNLDYWPNVGPVMQRPSLAVICPPALGARADQPDYDYFEDWTGGRAKSAALPHLLSAACEQRGLPCFDANEAVASSDRDPIHWTRESQIAFGQAIARWIRANGLAIDA